MKLLRFLFLICTMQSFGAIAQSNQLPAKFSTGELRYDCLWGCNFAFDYQRGTFDELYRNEDWIGLVKKVDEVGLKSRTSYFYLFRAAEKLKFYDAAQIYLNLAKRDPLVMGCFAINKLDVCKELTDINYVAVRNASSLENISKKEDTQVGASSTLLPTSNLPRCEGSVVASWNDCMGVIYERGLPFSGQFRNGIPYGQFEKIATAETQLANATTQTGSATALQTNTSSSNLAACPSSGYRHNCIGTFTSADGEILVSEYQNGVRFGHGIQYNKNGSILRSGTWLNDQLMSSHSVDKDSFPFNPLAITPATSNQSLLVQQAIGVNQTAPLVAVQPDNSERDKLLAEVELERKKRQELEEQLRVAQQTSQPSQPTTLLPSLPTMANRRALVIGNDTYKSVTKLANAREDARTIATNLTSVGFQVTLKLDVTEKEMKAALRTFAGQVQGGDEVLFFFAGHGVQLGATNYLLPTDIVGDSEAQVKDEAIQLQRVLDDMSEKKAKFTLAMVDACRDNPFKSTGRAIGGRGLAPTTAATGQMVIFSAGTGQQALDKLNNADKNKNGLFTRVFAQEMQKPNLTIDRVVKNVRNQVAQLAKSVGHDQVPAIYDQVLGDFYFKVSK